MNDSIYGAFQSKPRGLWHSEIWVMSYQLTAAFHWNAIHCSDNSFLWYFVLRVKLKCHPIIPKSNTGCMAIWEIHSFGLQNNKLIWKSESTSGYNNTPNSEGYEILGKMWKEEFPLKVEMCPQDKLSKNLKYYWDQDFCLFLNHLFFLNRS